MYIQRHIEEQVAYATQYYPVVLVCGLHGSGKTTMLQVMAIGDYNYVSLRDDVARRMARKNPAMFLDTYGAGGTLVIDDFQLAPNITLEMKYRIDMRKLAGEPVVGMYWLISSQKFVMMRGVTESLAGRMAVFDMSSFSAAELEGRKLWQFKPIVDEMAVRTTHVKAKTEREMYEKIFLGGMPYVCNNLMERKQYYVSWVQTYFESVAQKLVRNVNLNVFYKLLECVAVHTAQVLNYREIARYVGTTVATVKRCIQVLEMTGIIYLLRPISVSDVKYPKIYFMDTGLAAYLTRWDTPEVLENGAMSGAFFETYVVSEIVKSYWNAGRRADLYYYRDIDKKEIDLVIVENGNIYPIEIKRAKNPTAADKNFAVLNKLGLNVQQGIILCMCDTIMPYNRDVWLCPAWVI